MEFMPLTPHDIEEAPAWMREIPLRADRWRDRHTRSVVAKIEQMPAAAGILFNQLVAAGLARAEAASVADAELCAAYDAAHE